MASLSHQSQINENTFLFVTNPAPFIQLDGNPPITLSNDNGVLFTDASDIIINHSTLEQYVSAWAYFSTPTGQVLFSGGDGSNSNATSILENRDGYLYFNNELLAEAGMLSNIADWALYPAISNVNMFSNSIYNTSNFDNTYNANLCSNIGYGFGLINYSQTHLRGDILQENDYAAACNGNQPETRFRPTLFNVGYEGRILSNNGNWYNSNGTPFEVLDQNTQAPLYSAQPQINLYSRSINIQTPVITMETVYPFDISGSIILSENLTASNTTNLGKIVSSNLLPIPAATYTNTNINGNLKVGTLDAGQLYPYPDVNLTCDKFKVGNFIGQPGGENAPVVEMNGRTISIGSIGSSATTGINGIAVSMTGSATAGITSPVTTLTGGVVNITGAGGVAVTGAGGVAVTGGTVSINSPVGISIQGGGGVAMVGGLGVSIDGGVGVTVLGGGIVSISGGGGISVNDLGGATFRGGNVLLTLGANQTIDSGYLELTGPTATIKTNSIQPGNLGYLVIQDPGNTTTNTISINNCSALTAYPASPMTITNVGNIGMNPSGVITNVTNTSNNWVRIRAYEGLYVQNVSGSLPAGVYCGNVHLLDGTIPGGGVAMVLSNQGNSNFYANGQLVAYQSQLSNIGSNWSVYPAKQNVDMSGNAIGFAASIGFSNSNINPFLKNITSNQSIEIQAEQGLQVKNPNTLAREKIEAKTFLGDNIFLDGTVATPSIKMTSGNNSELYRINGDQQGTVRLTYDPITENGGFLLDSKLNPTILSLSTNILSIKAKDPTTDPTGNILKTLSQVILPNSGATAYGSFSATNTQLVSAADTPTKVNFNIADVNQGGFAISSGSIIVPYAGTYELIPSLIFSRSGGSLTTAYFWLQVNGVNVPNSGTQITMSGNGEETCPAAALITPTLNAGDNVAIYFASSDNTTQITATPASTSPYNRPLTPAAIMTIKLLQTSAIASPADIALQNRLQIVPVGTPTQSTIKFIGGVGSNSSWVPDQSPPIAGGTNNGWRFTKATGSPNTAKINWYPFNPYYPSAPSIGVPPSVIIRKCDLESLYFIITTQNNINVQGLLYLQIYTYDYVNGSSTFFTNRWDYVAPTYSGGLTTTPYTLQGGFKYLVCAVDPPKTTATPATTTTISFANGQFPSQRTTTKLRDPYDIYTDIPHLPFTFVSFTNSPTPQPADPSIIPISAFAVNTASATVTTPLDFTIEAIGYKAGGINYLYQLNYN